MNSSPQCSMLKLLDSPIIYASFPQAVTLIKKSWESLTVNPNVNLSTPTSAGKTQVVVTQKCCSLLFPTGGAAGREMRSVLTFSVRETFDISFPNDYPYHLLGGEKTNITKPNFYSLFFTLTTLDPSAERLMLYYVIYGFNDSLTGWEMLGCSSEMAIVASIVYTQLLSPVLITVARPFKLKWNKTNRTKWTIFTCNLMLAKLSAWWRKSVNLTDSFYYSLIVLPTDPTCGFFVCCTNTKYIFSFPIFYLVSQTADCVYTILLNLCGKNQNTRHISSPDMSDMLLSRISEFFLQTITKVLMSKSNSWSLKLQTL